MIVVGPILHETDAKLRVVFAPVRIYMLGAMIKLRFVYVEPYNQLRGCVRCSSRGILVTVLS